MRKVSVFFAGSTKSGRLDDERNQLKVLADDLSAEKNVQVVVYTFEHLGQTQTNYDRLIESKADLVICILTKESYQADDKGEHGLFTLRELSAAIKSFNEHKKPDVLVFYPKGEADPRHSLSSEIIIKKDGEKKDIAPLIRKFFEDHHPKEYDGCQDLMKECRKVFEKALEKRRVKALWKRIVTGVAAIGILSGLFFHFSDPKLLLVGGGSVANFIKEKGVNVDKRSNTMCVRMPSEASIVILAEEVNRMAAPDSAHNSRYTPVCMSARRAQLEEFTKVCTKNQLSEELRIIEYEVGTDAMAVYMDKAWCSEISGMFGTLGDDLCISNGKLLELLRSILTDKKLSADVFATSPGSGTREMYREILDRQTENSIVDSTAITKFHEYHLIEAKDVSSNRILALGSQYYTPKNYDDNPDKSELVKIIVTDSSNVAFSKNLYLYFAAKKKDSDYYLPRPDRRLLRDLGFNRWEENNINRHNGRMDIKTSSPIYKLSL